MGKVVIIGYGTAAVNAIIALRNSGYAGAIQVLSNTDTQPYSPILTSYLAGGTKDTEQCLPFAKEQLDRLDIEVVSNCRVDSVDFANRNVIASDDDYHYDKLLITTGASPSRGGFPRIEGYEPLALRTMEAGQEMANRLQSAKSVLISGTSMVALKVVEACLDRGITPTLLGRSEHILKRSALPSVAKAFENALESQGVQLRLGQSAVNAQLTDMGIEVAFSNGETALFDEIVIAHGMRPNLDFIPKNKLECDAGLIVDKYMRTSDPNVFAAGDVAQVLNLTTGFTSIAGIWKEACIQGECAGYAIAAEFTGTSLPSSAAYPGFIPNNTVFVNGTTLVAGGSAEITDNRYITETPTDTGLNVCVYERTNTASDKLVGFNAFTSAGKPGGRVFDDGAMYMRRLVEELRYIAPERPEVSVSSAASVNDESNSLVNHNAFWKFAGQCAECGRCTKSCSSLSASSLTLGGIAKMFLDCEAASEGEGDLAVELLGNFELTQAVRGCFLCTGCTQTCFASNNVLDLIHAGRVEYQDLGLLPRSAWSTVMVDEEWHIFTAYRAIHGIEYSDLTRHLPSENNSSNDNFDVAFFPGCSLASYGPELTREVFSAIENIGGRSTMIDKCCGSSLKSYGFYDRAIALADSIAAEIQACGAKQVVCVCPGCRNNIEAALKACGADAKAVTLARFLLENDFKPRKDIRDLKLRISKSCQDRDGIYIDEVRRLLDCSNAPIAYGGCCGAGGSVGPYSADQKDAQVARKLSAAIDGETLVTMCPTCTYTYAFHLMSNPRDINNKNYLELLFENQFDWAARSAELNEMWTGQYGAWLAHVFG